MISFILCSTCDSVRRVNYFHSAYKDTQGFPFLPLHPPDSFLLPSYLLSNFL